MGKEDKDSKQTEEFPDLRYGPLDYSQSKITTYLNPEQTEKLKEFRESIPTFWPETLTGVEEVFLTDATLCRYLRARDWSLSKAQKMLLETLKWRRDYKPWAITQNDIDGEMNNEGKMYRGGFDKHNRAILYMKPRHDNTGSELRETKVKYLVYCLEKTIRAGEANDREKITLLIDYSKYSQMAGLSMIRMAMDVLKILSDHYPERLGSAFMVHPSWSFTLFWKSISPFIDNVTKKKIFMINKLPELKDWIPEDVLEAEYGGSNEVKYSYEAIRGRDDLLYPPFNEAGQLVTPEGEVIVDAGEKKKKKKKKKKAAEGEEVTEDAEVVADSSEAQSAAASGSEPSESKKSKKSKKAAAGSDATANDEAGEEEPSASESTKSKKSKGESNDSAPSTEATDDSAASSKKKKSKKQVTESDN